MPEEEKDAETEGQEPDESGEPAPEAAGEPAEEPSAEEPSAEEPAEGEPSAEEPAEAEEPSAEEPSGEATPAEEPSAGEPAAEEPEVLGPKQRRKLARSRASGSAGPERSPEERAGERTTVRKSKAAARTRWRTKKSGDSDSRIAGSGQGGVAEARAPGKRKVRQGVVVSDKGDKTITVRIDRVGRHRVYGKVVHATGTLHAHDEQNEAAAGDTVRVIECRPLSRTKRWRLVEVLEKAK